MSLRGSFIPQTNIALFLDVDGTLLEIAATPAAVRVPAALRNTLQLAAKREDGALALISGRTIAELDRLFAPLMFPAAGQHGVEIRDVEGNVSMPSIDAGQLDPAREVSASSSALQRPAAGRQGLGAGGTFSAGAAVRTCRHGGHGRARESTARQVRAARWQVRHGTHAARLFQARCDRGVHAPAAVRGPHRLCSSATTSRTKRDSRRSTRLADIRYASAIWRPPPRSFDSAVSRP